MATPLPDSEYEEIDPLVDPGRANAIGTAVMSGAAFVPRDDAPPPVIEEPPDDVVHLPGGYLDRKGAVHSTVRIRELTGADEEELAKPAARRTAWHLVDTINRRCITHLGDTPVGTPEMPTSEIGNLLSGDRDMVAVAVRRITYGDTLELPVSCPLCLHAFDVKYDLRSKDDGGDVPVKKLPVDPARQQLEIDLPVHRRLGPGKATVRLVTGADWGAVTERNSDQSMSSQELTTQILKECVDAYRGRPVTSVQQILDMPGSDRKAIREFLTDTTCGPRFEEVTQECPGCHGNFPLVVNPELLFQ